MPPTSNVPSGKVLKNDVAGHQYRRHHSRHQLQVVFADDGVETQQDESTGDENGRYAVEEQLIMGVDRHRTTCRGKGSGTRILENTPPELL